MSYKEGLIIKKPRDTGLKMPNDDDLLKNPFGPIEEMFPGVVDFTRSNQILYRYLDILSILFRNPEKQLMSLTSVLESLNEIYKLGYREKFPKAINMIDETLGVGSLTSFTFVARQDLELLSDIKTGERTDLISFLSEINQIPNKPLWLIKALAFYEGVLQDKTLQVNAVEKEKLVQAYKSELEKINESIKCVKNTLEKDVIKQVQINRLRVEQSRKPLLKLGPRRNGTLQPAEQIGSMYQNKARELINEKLNSLRGNALATRSRTEFLLSSELKRDLKGHSNPIPYRDRFSDVIYRFLEDLEEIPHRQGFSKRYSKRIDKDQPTYLEEKYIEFSKIIGDILYTYAVLHEESVLLGVYNQEEADDQLYKFLQDISQTLVLGRQSILGRRNRVDDQGRLEMKLMNPEQEESVSAFLTYHLDWFNLPVEKVNFLRQFLDRINGKTIVEVINGQLPPTIYMVEKVSPYIKIYSSLGGEQGKEAVIRVRNIPMEYYKVPKPKHIIWGYEEIESPVRADSQLESIRAIEGYNWSRDDYTEDEHLKEQAEVRKELDQMQKDMANSPGETLIELIKYLDREFQSKLAEVRSNKELDLESQAKAIAKLEKHYIYQL